MRLARVLRDLLLCVLILLLVGLIAARLSQRQETVLSGHPRIVDGDTLVLDSTRIRLAGADAPELAQTCMKAGFDWPCGEAARDALRRLAAGAIVDCTIDGIDKFGRSLALCRAAGVDLGASLVLSGHAVAFGRYEAEEDEARRKRRGMWSGSFERPRTWREHHGGIGEAPHISGGWMETLWPDLLK